MAGAQHVRSHLKSTVQCILSYPKWLGPTPFHICEIFRYVKYCDYDNDNGTRMYIDYQLFTCSKIGLKSWLFQACIALFGSKVSDSLKEHN